MISYTFSEGAPTKDFEAAIQSEMGKPIEFFKRELTKVRAGRAHTSMVEDIKVSSYGTMMPLKQTAALSAPDVNLIVIQPWDKTLLGEIEKAIQTSELGITPVNDGNVIRIQLPKLSDERRIDLIKAIGKRAEEARVTIRAVRKDFHNLVRDAEKKKTLSEDYAKRLQQTLQKVTDAMVQDVDKMAQKKEQELKSI